MAFCFSRDDAGVFLPSYVEKGILPQDPFVALDQTGVGQLVEIAVEKGQSVKPNLKIGICGEHGGTGSGLEHRSLINQAATFIKIKGVISYYAYDLFFWLL